MKYSVWKSGGDMRLSYRVNKDEPCTTTISTTTITSDDQSGDQMEIPPSSGKTEMSEGQREENEAREEEAPVNNHTSSNYDTSMS